MSRTYTLSPIFLWQVYVNNFTILQSLAWNLSFLNSFIPVDSFSPIHTHTHTVTAVTFQSDQFWSFNTIASKCFSFCCCRECKHKVRTYVDLETFLITRIVFMDFQELKTMWFWPFSKCGYGCILCNFKFLA